MALVEQLFLVHLRQPHPRPMLDRPHQVMPRQLRRDIITSETLVEHLATRQ